MNLTALFTTARVLRAIYQTVSTATLLYYMGKRAREGRRITRGRRHDMHD